MRDWSQMLGRVGAARAIHLGALAHKQTVAEFLKQRYGLLAERDAGFVSEPSREVFEAWGRQIMDEAANGGTVSESGEPTTGRV